MKGNPDCYTSNGYFFKSCKNILKLFNKENNI